MANVDPIEALKRRIAELEAREAKEPSWKNRDTLWQLRAALKDLEAEASNARR